jgi:neurotransmitter:Na+ symporter, NSS family
MTFISDLSDIFLTVGGFLLCLFVAHRWKLHNMHEEIQEGAPSYMTSGIHNYINFSIRYLCPISLGIISAALILEKFFGLENIF